MQSIQTLQTVTKDYFSSSVTILFVKLFTAFSVFKACDQWQSWQVALVLALSSLCSWSQCLECTPVQLNPNQLFIFTTCSQLFSTVLNPNLLWIQFFTEILNIFTYITFNFNVYSSDGYNIFIVIYWFIKSIHHLPFNSFISNINYSIFQLTKLCSWKLLAWYVLVPILLSK